MIATFAYVALHVALTAQVGQPYPFSHTEGSYQHPVKCWTKPDPDGCNTDTYCEDGSTRVTLAYCVPKDYTYDFIAPIDDGSHRANLALPRCDVTRGIEPCLGAYQGPAEHVIEIRTRREQTAKICTNEMNPTTCICPEGYTQGQVTTENAVSLFLQCERVTKTLWIDGQRVGVIKEVEDR